MCVCVRVCVYVCVYVCVCVCAWVHCVLTLAVTGERGTDFCLFKLTDCLFNICFLFFVSPFRIVRRFCGADGQCGANTPKVPCHTFGLLCTGKVGLDLIKHVMYLSCNYNYDYDDKG